MPRPLPHPAPETPRLETPRLLLAGFGPYAQSPENPAGLVVEALMAQAWAPEGVRFHGKIVRPAWSSAAEELLETARTYACDGVLLLAASTRAAEFRVEMRAQNRVSRRRADVDGRLWPNDRILPTGPGVVRATAPIADMVQAIQAAGLPARASSESGDFVGNFTLYRLLTEFGCDNAEHAVGCLSIPVGSSPGPVEAAVKAATRAFALRLASPRPTALSA